MTIAAESIRRCIDAAARERRQWLPPTHEQDVKDGDGIAEVEDAVVVDVAGIVAAETRPGWDTGNR